MSFNRGLLLNLCACAILAAALPSGSAMAQISAGRGGGGGQDDQTAKDEAKKKKRDDEFGKAVAPLPSLRNAGPCPFVKVLYDAGRYIEFKDNQEASASAGYTGEIQNITSACAYKSDEPIRVTAQVLFELGHGPQAGGRGKTYRYWVAVTDRNHAVIDKREFELPVVFPRRPGSGVPSREPRRNCDPAEGLKVSGAKLRGLVGLERLGSASDPRWIIITELRVPRTLLAIARRRGARARRRDVAGLHAQSPGRSGRAGRLGHGGAGRGFDPLPPHRLRQHLDSARLRHGGGELGRSHAGADRRAGGSRR